MEKRSQRAFSSCVSHLYRKPASSSVGRAAGGKSAGTCLRFFVVHSSSVSAASSLPCRRYSAPRLFSVVLTVGLLERNIQKITFTLIPRMPWGTPAHSPVHFAGFVPAAVLAVRTRVLPLTLEMSIRQTEINSYSTQIKRGNQSITNMNPGERIMKLI